LSGGLRYVGGGARPAATLALIRYGRHTPACERRSGECVLKPHTCNCGYGDALRKQGEDPR
jgi:hypothetical protein